MSEKRFEVTRISRTTGFSTCLPYESLNKAKKDMYNEINDSSYAVQIWDNCKEDFVLFQQA